MGGNEVAKIIPELVGVHTVQVNANVGLTNSVSDTSGAYVLNSIVYHHTMEFSS